MRRSRFYHGSAVEDGTYKRKHMKMFRSLLPQGIAQQLSEIPT